VTTFKSIEWLDSGHLRILDQRALPSETVYVDCSTVDQVAEAIETMTVRGAPAIGVAAAYGMAIAALTSSNTRGGDIALDLQSAETMLRGTRPTAVNLGWALDQMRFHYADVDLIERDVLGEAMLEAAHRLAESDVEINKAIAKLGASLLPANALVVHHCNTGSLATVDYGTALGIIRNAHEQGQGVSVLVDETRPRLQGARLTCWELGQLGVPYRLIVDGASGHFMSTETVDACLVGCDRVAANGDVANKIGTYNLAIVARAHGVPFYVAAPTSSIDLSIPDGSSIHIEQRSPEEVTGLSGRSIAPDGCSVANPAFDVTPAAYVTAFVTEIGIVEPPFPENLSAVLRSKSAPTGRDT
jgi:methylthioribose-1-phosphate isomerase